MKEETIDRLRGEYESRGLDVPEQGRLAKLADKVDSGQRTWENVMAALDKAASDHPNRLEGMITTFGDGPSLADGGPNMTAEQAARYAGDDEDSVPAPDDQGPGEDE